MLANVDVATRRELEFVVVEEGTSQMVVLFSLRGAAAHLFASDVRNVNSQHTLGFQQGNMHWNSLDPVNNVLLLNKR